MHSRIAKSKLRRGMFVFPENICERVELVVGWVFQLKKCYSQSMQKNNWFVGVSKLVFIQE